jgi:O-antigen ligase
MPGKRLKIMLVSVIAMMIIAISWGDITSSDVYKNRIAEDGTFYNRVGAWVYCLRAFSESPVIGIGYGKIYKYIEHAQENMDIIYIKGWRAALEPHNTFLSLLGENGILGLIPFLFILWYVSRYIREYYHRANNHDDFEFSVAMVSIFVAYFVPMFFDKTGYYSKINNVFYLFVGMMVAKVENLHTQKNKIKLRSPVEIILQ